MKRKVISVFKYQLRTNVAIKVPVGDPKFLRKMIMIMYKIDRVGVETNSVVSHSDHPLPVR